MQVRRARVCKCFPPCHSPPATWEPAPMLVVMTNPIGCQRQQPSPVFQWVEPPSLITSAAVWCAKPPPHPLHCTARPPTSQTAPQGGGACGPDTLSSWWVLQSWKYYYYSTTTAGGEGYCHIILKVHQQKVHKYICNGTTATVPRWQNNCFSTTSIWHLSVLFTVTADGACLKRLMSFPVTAAHRRRWWGGWPVSDIIRQLSDRLQGSALCWVSGASRNLPLLCQHLQFLAYQGRATCLHLQQSHLHTDRGLAAEGQNREV